MQYVTLERAIACPHASAAVVADTAAQVLAAEGYRRGLGFGPTASYVRAYRPVWATIGAIALCWTGVGLLLLLVKTKDHCNVVIEDGPYGVVALVSGRIPASLPARLEAAQGGDPSPGAQQLPPPMLLTPSGGQAPAAQIVQPADPAAAPRSPDQHDAGAGRYPAPPVDPFPLPSAQPAPAAGPVGPAAPHRPPSRLAPAMPGDAPPSANGAPQAPPVAPPAPHRPDDDPFSTSSGRVPWATAGGKVPGPPGPPPVSPGPFSPQGIQPRSQQPATDSTGFVLRVDSGETLELGPFCLLGREPVAADGDPPARFIRFEDAKLSVSKTHIAYGVDEHGVWVMDRNSTNGTTLIDPSGQRTPCAPNVRHRVPAGAQIQIGQRRLTVELADHAHTH